MKRPLEVTNSQLKWQQKHLMLKFKVFDVLSAGKENDAKYTSTSV